MNSKKKMAKIAGIIYLLFAIISIVQAVYFPSLVVSGNATSTANLITSSELLFRNGILIGIVGQLIFVFLVLVLYRLLKEVDQTLALLMVIFVVMGASATFLNTFNKIAVLTILSGADFLSAIEKPQLDALAYMFLRVHSQGTQAIQMFWGLWLFPFGLLVFRSHFIPRILGVLLIIAGVPYVLTGLASIVLPQYRATFSAFSPFMMFFEAGELPIILWLVIKGAREQNSETRLVG